MLQQDIKGIVHPKIKMMALFTHPRATTKTCITPIEQKQAYFVFPFFPQLNEGQI